MRVTHGSLHMAKLFVQASSDVLTDVYNVHNSLHAGTFTYLYW